MIREQRPSTDVVEVRQQLGRGPNLIRGCGLFASATRSITLSITKPSLHFNPTLFFPQLHTIKGTGSCIKIPANDAWPLTTENQLLSDTLKQKLRLQFGIGMSGTTWRQVHSGTRHFNSKHVGSGHANTTASKFPMRPIQRNLLKGQSPKLKTPVQLPA